MEFFGDYILETCNKSSFRAFGLRSPRRCAPREDGQNKCEGARDIQRWGGVGVVIEGGMSAGRERGVVQEGEL